MITQLQCKQTKCQNLKTQFPKDLIYGSANNKRIFSKLNVHKTFRRRPGRVLHISCTFNLRPVSRGNIFIRYMTNVLKSRKKIQLCLERWLLWKYCTFLDNDESRVIKWFYCFDKMWRRVLIFFILLKSLYCKNTDPSTVGVLEEKVFLENS